MLKKVFVICLVFIISCLHISQSIFIDITPGQSRCIGQELDEEDTAVFKLGAYSMGSSKEKKQELIATITDPDGNELFSDSIDIGGAKEQEFHQNIEVRGVYDICFKLQHGKSTVRALVDLDFKSRSGRGKPDPSKRLAPEDIPSLEDELTSAEETLKDIAREIEFARREELLLRDAGEKTQSRIQWFSALSIIILVMTSLWQLIYLRKYFTDKKIL